MCIKTITYQPGVAHLFLLSLLALSVWGLVSDYTREDPEGGMNLQLVSQPGDCEEMTLKDASSWGNLLLAIDFYGKGVAHKSPLSKFPRDKGVSVGGNPMLAIQPLCRVSWPDVRCLWTNA